MRRCSRMKTGLEVLKPSPRGAPSRREEAAERPFVAEQGIDVKALFGRLGRKAGEVFDLEAVEIGALLAVTELGIRVEAGFESVLRRHSFAFRGARTRGF